MDARGHGRSEGQCVLIRSVDEFIDDQFLFHKKVLEKFYSKDQGFEQPPKCFIVAHSFGCMQTLNGMLRQEHMEGGRSRYDGVFFANPFWGFFNQRAMNRNYYFIYFIWLLRGDNGFCPEQHVDLATVEDHQMHYLFDKHSRYQRKFIPATTLVSFCQQIFAFQNLLQNPTQLSDKCKALPPLFMYNGNKDIMVSVEMAKELFDKLPTTKPKEQLLEEGLAHGPFSDGLEYKRRVKIICDWFDKISKSD